MGFGGSWGAWDGLWVGVRWPNWCRYGDWVAGLVVLVFGGHGMGCGLLVCWWFLQSVVSAVGICW